MEAFYYTFFRLHFPFFFFQLPSSGWTFISFPLFFPTTKTRPLFLTSPEFPLCEITLLLYSLQLSLWQTHTSFPPKFSGTIFHGISFFLVLMKAVFLAPPPFIGCHD